MKAASAAQRERVPGWDLLRGLCALAVMAYHLLEWQGIASISPLGTYGVYLFFLLSGASMAYVYDADRVATWGGAWRFLVTRWFRLAPLYLVACLVFLAMLAARNGFWASELPLRLALNASFAFGVYDPAIWALAVGGWSLGIEFVFYLAFPLLMQAARTRAGRWATLGALVLLQATWVLATVGRDGLAAAGVAYHQVPAFGAWFFAGCLIGQARREQGARLAGYCPVSPAAAKSKPWPARVALSGFPLWAGALGWAALGVLLLLSTLPSAGEELLGWRGLLLPAACALAVWASGQLRVVTPQGLALAGVMGRLTYGVYLLHPLVYFTLVWFLWPGVQAAAETPLAVGLVVAVGAAGVTCALAALGHRWVEVPGQRLANSLRFRPPAHPNQRSSARAPAAGAPIDSATQDGH